MKIAVIADAHANLPALEAVLKVIDEAGCEAIFHVGDAIAIGPYPAECVNLLDRTPNLKCVAGNHELYYLNGLLAPQPSWMSDGEVQHQMWTHRQLGNQRRSIVGQWPMAIAAAFEGVKTVFVHYGLTVCRGDFKGIVRNLSGADLDPVFEGCDAEIVFFGHDHAPSDTAGKAR